MKFLSLAFMLLITQSIFAQRLYPFPENGKWGYMNSKGETIVSPTYQSAGNFTEGMAKVSKINERDEYLYGFISSTGREVIPPKFTSVSDFDGGVARVRIRGRYNYLLKNGVIVTGNSFDEIYPATNGISRFRDNNYYGYADTNGNIILSNVYTSAFNFSTDGIAIVSTNTGRTREYGYIDTNGNYIIEPNYTGAKHFVNGFGAIQYRRKWYVIDTKGQPISDQGYDAVGEFENGLINVRKGSWGYINSVGERVIDFQYKVADKFSSGLAIVGDGNFFSYIDTSGTLVAPFEFTRVTRFDGKLARVSQGSKNGFMNATGRYNLTEKISSIGSFFQGRARMKVGGYFGYYSSDARLAIRPQYLHASDFDGDLALTVSPIQGGYKIAYINVSGTIIKTWSVLYQPLLKNQEVFYSMIYPSVPFYRDSDPTSRVIIRANYGDEFVKTHQRTATPLLGHGVQGLLYSAEYFARPGYIFSEVVTRYTPPKIGIGITAYFRENIGVISDTGSPTAFNGPMSTVFFNAATLNRSVDRTTVRDDYTVPFMKVSEAFFLLSAALGYPVSEYPENSGNLPNYLSNPDNIRFVGRRDSDNKPTEFALAVGRSRVIVREGNYGVNISYTYPIPSARTSLSTREPIFASDPKDVAKLESELTILTNELIDAGYSISNANNTNIIIEQVSTTNSIDMTDAVIQDRMSNSVSVAIPTTNQVIVTNEVIQVTNQVTVTNEFTE